jgi:hypothetical protein
MNKAVLQDKLVEIHRTIIGEIKEKIAASHNAIDIDESDTIDPEDLSHQSEEATLKLLYQKQLKQAEKEIQSIQKIDFSTKNKVEPGAFVETDALCFFIGSPVLPFEFEGKRVIGISVDSPIMHEITGKGMHDSFSYNDKMYAIKAIY